ncbi:terminase large subunit [Microbacterium phage Zeta1847]|uniref:Terminase large subunit n=1 Tax=Microbacterium phage Zeta1847 TaxID=2201444 RepID=A0A2Z4Q984_9CAUD|nr:terminase large subunit [Microbacterium phage Zeta1847]AWY06636.1 terminase large subunit [Microbacterium phage Zeta1847]
MQDAGLLPPFPLDKPTLGHAVIGWIESTLWRPDGVDELIELTAEQRNFVLHFYAVELVGRDTFGRPVWQFVCRRGILRRAKGWGKSPFLGAIALAELCGPVLPVDIDDDGFPYAVPHPMPWVVIAGVSETQTKNTTDAIRAMAGNPDFVEAYGVDVGMTRILTPGGGKLVAVTASASTAEGGRYTFAILDETHHWTESNRGHDLADVIRRNLGKVDGRSIETTNAHEPGRDSTAEKSYLAHLAILEGRADADGILYDSRQAPDDIDLADRDAVRKGLELAYGDSHWVNLDRIIREFYDPDLPPEQARRFYLNQIVAAADSWLAPSELEANRKPNIPPLKLGTWDSRRGSTGDTVALGFDGSLTDDSTALVAVRIDDGAPFLLAIWERPEGPAGVGWHVPKQDVRDAVDYAFAHLDVVAFFSDVAYWETDVDAWRDTYAERLLVKATTRHAVAWDMRAHQQDTTRATEALHRAFIDGDVPWRPHELLTGAASRLGLIGSEILRRHILNARRRINRWGISFGKETRESTKKVDALAALLLARMARSRVLEAGALKSKRKQPGRLYGF